MPKKRKAETAPITKQEFQQQLERIAANIGKRRALQIADTAIKLIKMGIPKKAVSVCLNHIIELACEDSAAEPSPVEQRIAELKESLDYLNTLEDEGMRFRIMREIQDLESALDMCAGEWPDIIAA
jgi:hypothetical protein